MTKPREFWLWINSKNEIASPDEIAVLTHVREVVELKTEEITKAADAKYHDYEKMATFEAGARWAIAKMRGDVE